MTPRSAVELFHLVFLAELGRRIDQRLYVVKGGCNLRFFFGSPRYSEDLDLDVHTVGFGTLQKKVTDLLDSRPFAVVLESKGVRVSRHSAPKQTETTQRWKVALEGDAGMPLHTKIEFSRRKADGKAAFDPVDPLLIVEHGIGPVLATHYTGEAAFAQKIRALAGRPEAQARDVFDLDLLLRAGHAAPGEATIARADVNKARANAESVDFDAFTGQVVAFLRPEDQRNFGTNASWSSLVERVIEALEGRLS